MLVCRACNTRYESARRACPSCGRRSTGNATESAAGESGPLPPGNAPDSGGAEIDLDLEMEESAVVDSNRQSAAGVGKKPPAGASAAVTGDAARAPKCEIDADPEQVKALLAEQPGLLEKGLGLHADEDGELDGVDFATPVGSIDLLGRDRKGGFVVVHIPAPDEISDSVSAMLRRMGWVRKHLAEDGEDVRGVMVLDQLPEDLAYAAAGAAGSIAFKGYQLSLSFHELEG